MKFQEPFADFSSRIKTVFIELPDFGFYHGPSDSKNKDKRIIGRKHLVQRLQNIILNSDSSTGAYLVTGYRGTGKSSLVSHVLSDLTLPESKARPLRKILFHLLIIACLGIIWDLFLIKQFMTKDDPFLLSDLFFGLYAFVIVILGFTKYRLSHDYMLNESIARMLFYFKSATQKNVFYHFGSLYSGGKYVRNKQDTFRFWINWFFFLLSIFIKIADVIVHIFIGGLTSHKSNKHGQQHVRIIQNIYLLLTTMFAGLFYYNQLKAESVEYITFVFLIALLILYVAAQIYKSLYPLLRKFYLNWFSKIYFKIFKRLRWARHQTKPKKNNIRYFRHYFSNLTKLLIKIFKMKYWRHWKYLMRRKKYKLLSTIVKVAIKKTVGLLINSMKKFFARIYNRSRMIPIHLNFSYSNLEEKEILHLITQNIRDEFKKRRKRGIGWYYPGFALLLLMILLIQEIEPVKQARNEVQQVYQVTHLFPSQLLRAERSNEVPTIFQDSTIMIKYNPLTKLRYQKALCEQYMQFLSAQKYNFAQMHNSIFNTNTKQIAPVSPDKKFILYYIKGTVFYADLFILTRWLSFKSWVGSLLNDAGAGMITGNNYIVKINQYLTLNYFPVFWILLIFFLHRKLKYRINILGLHTNHQIEKELDLLYESILSSRSESKQDHSGVKYGAWFSRTRYRRRHYDAANARDIEKGLIHILQKISEIPPYMYRPEFIIVFDELDKVNTEETEENGGEKKTTSQARQIIIYKLLENLKYFMTTAPAKFIIIAGREMYDSYLADMTDRELNLRNIFNDVIYVPTFLTPPRDVFDHEDADITKLTEQYLCQFLMPEEYIKDKVPDLQTFKQYMQQRYTEFMFPINLIKGEYANERRNNEGDWDYKMHRQRVEKVITILYQFVIYLLHMSNGIPKKIVSLFEQHIIKGEKQGLQEARQGIHFVHDLAVGKNPENFHLVFTPEKQYEIGLISSIMSPVFYSISSHLKSHNDKLLFSTTFIINHLLKFHTAAFSHGSLESSPEITAVYRNPEVRAYLSRTVQYLSQTQLEEITGGFHEFKFPKQTALEISYLSRISDMASAAFRFSLDESRTIRNFYQHKLKNTKENTPTGNYLKTLSAHYYHMLGNVSFYEDDYDEALRCYHTALGLLPENHEETEGLILIMRLKISLQTGLSYERMHHYDEAYHFYAHALNSASAYRQVSLKKLKVSLGVVEEMQYFVSDEQLITDEEALFVQACTIKNQHKIQASAEHFQKQLAEHMTGDKIEYLQRIYSVESHPVYFQPILSKLQVIEKSTAEGITKKDINHAIDEFKFLMRPADMVKKHMIAASFRKKMANILYYKNLYYSGTKPEFEKYSAAQHYLFSLHYHLLHFTKEKNQFIEPTQDLTKQNLAQTMRRLLAEAYDQFDEKKHRSNRTELMQSIAELLSSLGNICFFLLSPMSSEADEALETLSKIQKEKSHNEGTKETFKPEDILKIEYAPTLIGMAYYLSAQYFMRAKKYKQHAFQIQKIFYFMFDLCEYSGSDRDVADFKNKLHSDLNNRKTGVLHERYKTSNRSSYGAYENVHIMQLEKLKEFLHEPDYMNDDMRDRVSLKKLTIDVDIEPLTFMYERLILLKINSAKSLAEAYCKNLASPYLLENSMFNKAIKLRYKATLNRKIVEYFRMSDVFKPFSVFKPTLFIIFFKRLSMQNNQVANVFMDHLRQRTGNYERTINDLFEHLVTDSIYCLAEILEVYNTFGQDNIFNHSFIANVHEEMVYWLTIYRYYSYFMELAGMMEDIGDIEIVKTREPWHRFILPIRRLGKIHGTDVSENKLNSAMSDALRGIYKNGIVTPHGIDNNHKGRIRDMKLNMTRLLRKDSQNSLDPIYHGEQAILHYHTATDLHKEGKAYQQLIKELYHLDDDTNDALFHFRLAQERYRIKSGWITKRKDEINKFLQYTSLYDQDAYVKTILY